MMTPCDEKAGEGKDADKRMKCTGMKMAEAMETAKIPHPLATLERLDF